MSVDRIESLGNIDDLLKNSNWEIDKEFPVFKSYFEIKIAPQDTICFAHHSRETFYAISCVSHSNDYNKLSIERFEVNKPFRGKDVCTFALHELLKRCEFNITTIELESISPKSDKFFKSLKMQNEGSNKFSGDETWLSNFMKSLTNKNKNDIKEKIQSIRNRLCDEDYEKK